MPSETVFSTTALQDKRILVTGASSGIGLATAQRLSQCGAMVLLTGRNEGRLSKTLASLAGSGHSARVWDLEATDSIPDFMAQLAQEWGAFNGVFHAAGTESIRAVSLMKAQTIDAVLAPTLKATLMLARGLIQKNVASSEGASMVVMSSVASMRGQAGLSLYSAAKAAVDGAIRSLACELAPRSIRINSISAGAVRTAMHDRITRNLSEAGIKQYEDRHLLGFGNPEDVAAAAVFLVSNAARWITGSSLVVDGGYSCR